MYSLSPASGVIAVTVLLTAAVPAELETVTLMVYLLPGSSPVIVYPVKSPFTEIVFSFTSEQPTEVSLCHSTSNPVTTELGTLPVILMVVAVTDGGSSSTAADGTEREQSLISTVAH